MTRIMFDTKTEARGVTVEERRTDEWRRRMVARDIGSRVARTGGAAAWLGPYELAWFGSLGEANWITRTAGGLLMRQPAISPFSSGAAAAQDVLSSRLGVCDAAAVPDAEAIVAEFERSFPEGLVYHADRPVPFGMAVLSSRERCDVLRAALRFVRDPVPAKQPHRWDITALADGRRLRVIFVIDRRHHTTARRQWAKRVRAWDLATAALGDRADRPLTNAPPRLPEL